jgi:WXG100 family type VII secretion target
MADFSVNTNSLLDAGSELQEVTRSLQTSLGELDRLVENFKQVNQGEASIAFAAAQQEWHAGMSQMQASLAAASQRLDTIHQNYVGADNLAAQRFRGV